MNPNPYCNKIKVPLIFGKSQVMFRSNFKAWVSGCVQLLSPFIVLCYEPGDPNTLLIKEYTLNFIGEP